MEHWKITRERSRCPKAGCPLPVAQQWMAVLDLPQCVRRDVCDACFTQELQVARKEGDGREPVFWRCHRKAKDKKEPQLDLGTLKMLFERLGEVVGEGPVDFDLAADAEPAGGPGGSGADGGAGEDGDPADGRDAADGDGEAVRGIDRARAASLRYFVALLLLRKRRLRALPARTEAQAAADLVVKDPKKPEDPPILLYAPELSESDLGTLKDELLALADPDYEPRGDVSKVG